MSVNTRKLSMDLWVSGSIKVPSRASPVCNLDKAYASVF